MSFDQQALIRSITNCPGNYMLLLGAGASASSGVPTGSQCIWEWKREIFLSSNPGLSPALFSDITLPCIQAKVQTWLDQQGEHPPLGHISEYVYYIEKCYPRSEDRIAFFQKRLAGVVPQTGYQLLAMLHNANVFRWIWTTNFDSLVRQARRPEHTCPLREVGLDTTTRLRDIQQPDESGYLIALHGDYKYDRLQNTSSETQALNAELCRSLIARLRKLPLIVIGYGGRDESVMRALEEAFQGKSEGGGIYWCILPTEKVSGRVASLMDLARSNNFESEIVEIDGFDDLMVRTARFFFRTGSAAADVDKLLSGIAPERSPFRFVNYRADDDWIKSNAYPVEIPREMYQFEAKTITSWKQLREVVGESSVVAGLLKGKVLAVADATEISRVFAGRISSRLESVPLGPRDFFRTDSVTVSILLEALRRTIATTTGLGLKGKRGLWDKSRPRVIPYGSQQYKVFEAVKLYLSFPNNRQFLNVLPDLHVVNEDGTEASEEATKEIKRQLLTKQYNKQYDDALMGWCDKILAEEGARTFIYPYDCIDKFVFKISSRPALARISNRSPFSSQPAPSKPGEIFQATVLNEPMLVFGGKSSFRHKNPHPLRGVVKDGPYDLELTLSGSCQEIRLGVVCPNGYETVLQRYLNKLVFAHTGVESKQEYLIPYPGFQQAYRIPLRVPQHSEVEWRRLTPSQVGGRSNVQIHKDIAAAVRREIDVIANTTSVDVVVIFIPSAWQPYEVVEDESLQLDLHDYIKAHCAQRGVRTQFLREATTSKSLQCEVLWWLAQAIYVKSLRTPFVLDNSDSDTVFVGIGYGISKGPHGGVVLGCSHIYDAAGQGLRYQVSRIQNPVWINDNPFLTKDDAIRVGYQSRQLFYQTYQKLPRRVVIHKRTPFTRPEREGLAQALKGISELEMVTLEFEDAWRFVAYNRFKKDTDMFPVKRNTVMIYDENECLLWVHGSIKGVSEGNFTYYQGKSRIPAPIKITRFAGHSSIETIATEILGLSKMDWNSCDLYGRLPATLESSSAIARVGQLLTRFGPETYDYRLFI